MSLYDTPFFLIGYTNLINLSIEKVNYFIKTY
nr:MAG TPA: hypothetical protein [Caudoviricetes sp.]